MSGMNKIAVVTMVLLSLAGAAFAEGAQEAPGRDFPEETTTLTGTIDISDFPPVLTADGKEYLVMVPRFLADDIEIEDGSTVTLEGYVHEAYGRFASDDTEVISVTKATIDGTEYEVDRRGTGGRFARGAAPYGEGCCGPRGQSNMQRGSNQPRGWR